jgi:hypothetical protein
MPLKIKVRAEFPRLNYPGFKGNIGQLGRKHLRLATREWVRAVVKKVPVYSGTARGTLSPLGRYVNAAVPRGKVVGPTGGTKVIQGKTYNLGFDGGKTHGQNFELSQDATPLKTSWTLTFHHDLVYFIWDNYGKPLNTLKKAPWDALKSGDLAFREHVKQKFVPEIAPLIGSLFEKVVVRS